jgi:hypothetical protein
VIFGEKTKSAVADVFLATIMINKGDGQCEYAISIFNFPLTVILISKFLLIPNVNKSFGLKARRRKTKSEFQFLK